MDFFKAEKFRPSKEDIWRQIADEIGGEFIPGGFWKKDALEFSHKHWTIVLDSFSEGQGHNRKVYTRIRAPFINKDGFYFNIYRKNIFSDVFKTLGMQDIEIGYPFFDDEFVIKSNAETKIKQLLNSDALRKLIQDIPRINFQIKDSERKFFIKTFPKGVDMLYFQCRHIVDDSDNLKNLFLLFSAVLERLVQMDSAYEDDPEIEII